MRFKRVCNYWVKAVRCPLVNFLLCKSKSEFIWPVIWLFCSSKFSGNVWHRVSSWTRLNCSVMDHILQWDFHFLFPFSFYLNHLCISVDELLMEWEQCDVSDHALGFNIIMIQNGIQDITNTQMFDCSCTIEENGEINLEGSLMI